MIFSRIQPSASIDNYNYHLFLDTKRKKQPKTIHKRGEKSTEKILIYIFLTKKQLSFFRWLVSKGFTNENKEMYKYLESFNNQFDVYLK